MSFEQRNWGDIMADDRIARDRRAAERRRLGIGQSEWYRDRTPTAGDKYLRELSGKVADREAERIGYRPKLAGFDYGVEFDQRHQVRIDRISEDERRTLTQLFDGEADEESESVYGRRFDSSYQTDGQRTASREQTEQSDGTLLGGTETPGDEIPNED